MPMHLPILRILLGPPRSTDIRVSRSQDGGTFHLPDQRCGVFRQSPMLLAAVVHSIALELLTGLPFYLPVLIAAYLAWRFRWHYRITLTRKNLTVECITSWTWPVVQVISCSRIAQFTAVQRGRTALLLAESISDVAETIVPSGDAAMLARLAHMLRDCHAELGEAETPIRVAVETVDKKCGERAQPPLNSRIVLKRHPTGVMLDFPAPARVESVLASRPWWNRGSASSAAIAWLILLPVLVLQGVLFGEAVRQHGAAAAVLVVAFVFSSAVFVIATAYWLRLGFMQINRRQANDELRRLAIADDMLVRTLLDGGKQVWYREEIDRLDIVPENGFWHPRTLSLNLVTMAGASIELYGPVPDDGREDYRPKAELEWVAAVLRGALADVRPLEMPGTAADTHICDRAGYRRAPG